MGTAGFVNVWLDPIYRLGFGVGCGTTSVTWGSPPMDEAVANLARHCDARGLVHMHHRFLGFRTEG